MRAEWGPGVPWASGLNFVNLIPERVAERFGRLDHGLAHTLHVASSNALLRRVAKESQARYIPTVWGVRRDDYRWDVSGSRRDVRAFRSAASVVTSALLAYPLSTWGKLLPGSVPELIGRCSSLFLADYWVLTLHHLVWTKQLPYSIEAQWIEGGSVHDERFHFVSELPVDLTEASHDALVLFRERALAKLTDKSWPEDETPAHETERGVTEPPIYCDGRWRSVWDEPSGSPARQPKDAVEVDPVERPLPPVPVPRESAEFELDDQAFVVRSGDVSYRFTSRNKQLFALLERISRRPGHRILFDDLRAKGDVWDGAPVEDSTIRGAVTRLRKTLRENGLVDLAARIATASYYGSCYVVLNDLDTPNVRGEQMLYAG